MTEFIRIIRNRKYITTVFLLLISNILIFQFYNKDGIERMQYHDSIREYVEEYKAYNEQKVEDYYNILDNMESNAREMMEADIFSNSSSFSYRNIQKTLNDYERISDVKIDNVFGAGLDSILEYDVIHYVVIMHAFILILMFFDERKRGLWGLIYACKYGRVRLSVYRVLILFVNCAVFTVLAYVSVIVTALYDYDSFYLLTRPAQSIALLQNFTLPLSIGAFLGYWIVMQVIRVLFTALVIWIIFSLIHNRTYAMVIIGLMLLIGYYLNDSLSGQNPMCVLKYFNLYYLLNTTESYTSYVNFQMAGLLINNREFSELFTTIGIVIMPIICVIINVLVKPVYNVGIVERLLTRAVEIMHGTVRFVHGFGFELYKFMIVCRGFLVIALLGIISFRSMELKNLTRTEAYNSVKEFYREYSGEISGERLEKYETMVSDIEEAVKEYRYKNEQYAQGKISEEELAQAEYEYKKYSADIEVADILKERVDRKEIIERKGVKAWFVDMDGIRHLIGESGRIKRIINNLMTAFVIILCTIMYRIYEYKSGMFYIIRPTPRGRSRLNRNVVLSIVLISLVSCGLVFGMECYDIWYSYGLGNLSAPVQNVDELLDFPLKISMGMYLIMWYTFRCMILTVIGLLVNRIITFLQKKRGMV